MALPTFLTYALTYANYFKYPLVFIGAIIEGPVLMVASGFLLHRKVFDAIPLFFALMLGDLLADVGWYFIGRFFAEPLLRNHGHFLSITPEVLEKAKQLFHHYHAKILFISKITIGFGMSLATLMTAGAARIPLRKYLSLNALGELILIPTLLTLGYFFGQASSYLNSTFEIIFLIGVAGVVIFSMRFFSQYMKKKITET